MQDLYLFSAILTLEAFCMRVASPAIRTVADRSVLLSATSGIVTTRILHQARVNTHLIDACLITVTVWIYTTFRLHLRYCCKE